MVGFRLFAQGVLGARFRCDSRLQSARSHFPGRGVLHRRGLNLRSRCVAEMNEAQSRWIRNRLSVRTPDIIPLNDLNDALESGKMPVWRQKDVVEVQRSHADVCGCIR
jgi:hypothetical protein